MNPDDVSEAILLYTGRGITNRPMRDLERLGARFQPERVNELRRKVRRLVAEFYLTSPRVDESLIESADRAAEAFRKHHPEISEEAVDALRWCFAWDWK
jgi:hypothetical protein